VANLAVLSEFCLPFVKVGGSFISLKGPDVEQELSEGETAISKLGGKVEQVIKIEIPNSDITHSLVIIKKIENTPKVYPRKAGTASKKPIK
jgi:16S rRNA (guanine527-N7)-methyltransferase